MGKRIQVKNLARGLFNGGNRREKSIIVELGVGLYYDFFGRVGELKLFQAGEWRKAQLQDIGAGPGLAANIAAEKVQEHIVVADFANLIREDALQAGAQSQDFHFDAGFLP